MKLQKEKKHWMPPMVSMPEIYIFEIPSCATWKFMNSLESEQNCALFIHIDDVIILPQHLHFSLLCRRRFSSSIYYNERKKT